MGAGPDNKPLASPGNFFPRRKRRVAELFAELLGRSFLPFPHFAAVDHHIMRVALSLDLDLAKFDQSCFHISMFRWLELQGKRQTHNVRLILRTLCAQFSLDALPPLFYDFASCIQDGAADGLCMGQRTRGRYPP